MIFAIILIVVLGVLFILLGRYTLEIHCSRSSVGSDLRFSLRSRASILGMDYNLSESSFRMIFFNRGIKFPIRKRFETPEFKAGSEAHSARIKKEMLRIHVHALGKWIYHGRPFLKKIIRVFRFERLALNLHFGTGDPATTGMLYGLAQSLLPVRIERFKTRLVPHFFEWKLEGEADLSVRFLLFQLAAVLIYDGIRLSVAMRRA